MGEGEEIGHRNCSMGEEVQDYVDVLSNNYNDDVIEEEVLHNGNMMDIGCLSSIEGSCDLSNFDHDDFDVEEAVVLMYQ